MDFDLSEEERALAEGIRDVCSGRFPIEHVASLEDAGGFDRDGWQALVDAGVLALRLPEDAGGVGLGMVHAALVFTELGRALVPGPLVGSHLAAGLVEGAAEGRAVVGGVHRGAGEVVIEHLDALDVLVVVDDDGLWHLDPGSLDAVPVARPLDPLTPLHRVTSLPQGDRLAAADTAATWRREGTVLVAALQLGIADAVTEQAVAYAKEREQFGKPIGAFQAVKHMVADMFVRTEVARAAVHAAAVHLDGAGTDDVERTVAGAALLAGEAAAKNAKACVQVHGGMGFTWEVHVHRYLKRAWLLETAFGNADEHAAALAARL